MAAPNEEGLRAIGRKFASQNGFDPSGDPLYPMDGTTEDWTYGKFGIPSFSFTVGSSLGDCVGYFPCYGCLDGIDGAPRSFWMENKPAFLYAHKIARTSYITVWGPDTQNGSAIPEIVFAGTPVQLTASVADLRYGGDTLTPVAAAEYFIDVPGEYGTGYPMAPADGSWGGLSEDVIATLDTCGLTCGQHYIMIRGQNEAGDWGPFTAVFFQVENSGDIDCDSDVDMTDFGIFTQAWLTKPGDLNWNPKCNLGVPVDGVIDMHDLAVLIDTWLTGVE